MHKCNLSYKEEPNIILLKKVNWEQLLQCCRPLVSMWNHCSLCHLGIEEMLHGRESTIQSREAWFATGAPTTFFTLLWAEKLNRTTTMRWLLKVLILTVALSSPTRSQKRRRTGQRDDNEVIVNGAKSKYFKRPQKISALYIIASRDASLFKSVVTSI